jgi:hypothetical protein
MQFWGIRTDGLSAPRRIAGSVACLWLVRFLVVASFVLYTAAALSLHQAKHIPFYVEEDDPLPAVLSHWIYGLPLGTVDRGLETYFQSPEIRELPADIAVQGAFARGAPPSGNIGLTSDGIGVGSFVFENIAFFIVGPKAHSLPVFFLSLLGISTAMFLIRFRDHRLVAVPIYFTGTTLLAMTNLSVMPDAGQVPIGGMRYFAILGILPALHWCFEFLDASESPQPWPTKRSATLAVQTTLMAIGILVRGSPLYLLIIVGISGYVGCCRKRQRTRAMSELMRCLIFGAAPLVVAITLILAAYPKYASAGRTFGNVWHRAFVSFAMTNPNWPFPGLRQTYDCTDIIPEGLSRAAPDRNGHCIWIVHERRLGVPDAEAGLKTYDGDYEIALRNAFFRLWRDYPLESFLTFFYYKPINISMNTVYSVKLNTEWLAKKPIRWFVGAQMLILVLLMCLNGQSFKKIVVASMVFMGGLWACALMPQWLAWSTPSTATDTTVCALSAFAFGLSAAIAGLTLKAITLGWSYVGAGSRPCRNRLS